MRDTCKNLEIDTKIHTVEYNPEVVDNKAREKGKEINFIIGDLYDIEKVLPQDFMNSLKHPILITDDAHVNIANNLTYLNQFLEEGDYLFVEDLNPDSSNVIFDPFNFE